MGDMLDAIDSMVNGSAKPNYDQLYADAGQKYGVNPQLIKAVATTESSQNPNAISHDSSGKPIAHGLMQLTHPTAQSLGVTDPYDPAQSIDAGAKLLKQNLVASNGNQVQALKMYHGGTDTNNWGPKTNAYPTKVLANMPKEESNPNDFNGSAIDSMVNSYKPTPDPVVTDNSVAKNNPNLPAYKNVLNNINTPTTATNYPKPVVDSSAPSTDTSGYGEAALHVASGIGSNIMGGWHGLLTLAKGGSIDEASRDVNSDVTSGTYQPKGVQGKKAVELLQSPKNPMNWVQNGAHYLGEKTFDATGSPALSTAVETGIDAVPLILGLKGGNKPVNMTSDVNPSVSRIVNSANGMPPELRSVPISEVAYPKALETPTYLRNKAGQPAPQPVVTEAPSAPVQAPASNVVPINPNAPTSLSTELTPAESAPVEGGLPLPVQNARSDVLKRIDGLDKVWNSAVSGDAMEGATNAQLSKFNEPAGVAAKEQFAHEYGALTNHTTNIIKNTGGTLGLDEESLNNRGQTIAAPFDALSKHFDNAIKTLYKEADTRSGGLPSVSTELIENLLNDRSFNNSAMAQDKGNLVNAIKNQLELFKENNPEGLTVANSEGFRKWLNQQWSNDNKKIIGNVTDAVDNAVLQSAGEDVYGQGRNLFKLKKETLDNPNGIARLMDKDPNTPINRVTPFEKIPDTLTRLSVDQFKNVIDTLRGMPDELQGQAQQALGEIKAHLANKILDAGQPNTKTPSTFWNNRKVNNLLDSNNEKINYAFTPAELAKISDLKSAGNILSVDASYPGAAAQANNAARTGLMSRIIPAITTSAGGAAGSMFGPAGSAAGAFAGRALGESMSLKSSEANALKTVGKRMNSLDSLNKIGK